MGDWLLERASAFLDALVAHYLAPAIALAIAGAVRHYRLTRRTVLGYRGHVSLKNNSVFSVFTPLSTPTGSRIWHKGRSFPCAQSEVRAAKSDPGCAQKRQLAQQAKADVRL